MRIHTLLISLLSAALLRAPGLAASAADLGKTLTPLGAEAAGNADGSIPAWTGGLDKNVHAHAPGTHYADPFADDKPLFTITAQNLAQYRERLTPGQLALFARYPDYSMAVYPSRRTASFPQAFYDKTRENVGKAQLAADGNGVVNAVDGVPFPLPKNGSEAIWNALLRYRGGSWQATYTDAPVLRNGGYTPSRYILDLESHYNKLSADRRVPNRLVNFMQTFVAPPRIAGTVNLVYEPIDQVSEPRTAWLYNAGLRRVRLAPNVAYDNPPPSAEGLRTFDDYQMFNGSPGRYTWTLQGKKEIYVPYNSYKMSGPSVSSRDLIRPGHLNQAPLRYELHRVWVVEAALKPGVRNVYHRRVFYLDEDSWFPLVADKYDSGGRLWRVAEQHSINLYDVPMLFFTAMAQYDLSSGRYLVMGMANDEPALYVEKRFPSSYFTPASVRTLGTR